MDIDLLEHTITNTALPKKLKEQILLLIQQNKTLENDLNKTKRKLQLSRDSVFPLSCEKDEFAFQNRELREEIAQLKKKEETTYVTFNLQPHCEITVYPFPKEKDTNKGLGNNIQKEYNNPLLEHGIENHIIGLAISMLEKENIDITSIYNSFGIDPYNSQYVRVTNL